MRNSGKDMDILIQTISSVTGESIEKVNDRLLDEILLLGTNVTRDIHGLGIQPHYYSDKMEAFYNDNDSFLYELIVYQITRQRQKLGKRYLEIAGELQKTRLASCSVLCLGDGIGVDSLAFLKQGYEVTYFDFPCKSYDFAEKLWEKHGVRPTVINDLAKIPSNAYDIVLNSDVLEHVQYPAEVIRNIAGYLRDGGLAIVVATYPAIFPNLATHLIANLKNYWGETIGLFEKNRMVVSNFSELKGIPFVFKKYSDAGAFRKALLSSFFDKHALMVRMHEYLNKIRRIRVAMKNKHRIHQPDYLADVVSPNESPLLHLNSTSNH